jgi:hypothetical protein
VHVAAFAYPSAAQEEVSDDGGRDATGPAVESEISASSAGLFPAGGETVMVLCPCDGWPTFLAGGLCQLSPAADMPRA